MVIGAPAAFIAFKVAEWRLGKSIRAQDERAAQAYNQALRRRIVALARSPDGAPTP